MDTSTPNPQPPQCRICDDPATVELVINPGRASEQCQRHARISIHSVLEYGNAGDTMSVKLLEDGPGLVRVRRARERERETQAAKS